MNKHKYTSSLKQQAYRQQAIKHWWHMVAYCGLMLVQMMGGVIVVIGAFTGKPLHLMAVAGVVLALLFYLAWMSFQHHQQRYSKFWELSQ